MNNRVHPYRAAEYRRLRKKGWFAHIAWETAKVNANWRMIEGDLVKLELEPEFDRYDDSFLDEGVSKERAEKDRKELWERIEREGVWIVSVFFRKKRSDEWIFVDSIGGFIGNDWEDSGYDTDLKRAAMDALYAEDKLEAKFS